MSSQFKPKVLKDQVVKFYKKPKKMKNGYISYGVINSFYQPKKKIPEGATDNPKLHKELYKKPKKMSNGRVYYEFKEKYKQFPLAGVIEKEKNNA